MDLGGELPDFSIKSDIDRLRWDFANKALSIDLISAYAGDRHLTPAEIDFVNDFKKGLEGRFYSYILYAITHQYFQPDIAEDLWNKILKHKYEMSVIMRRNIRIAVAALDYLSNLTDKIRSATVIDEEQIADIVQLSLRDGLTGLFNHASCYQKIDMELKRYNRYKTVVSIMMIDIDNFKVINDMYGHTEGDKILALLGSIILNSSRDSDICCRYGGEEFAVILPSTEAREAGVLAERLREQIEKSLAGGRSVTVSIGVASCEGVGCTSLELVKKADAALYEAKRNGKNQVVVAG